MTYISKWSHATCSRFCWSRSHIHIITTGRFLTLINAHQPCCLRLRIIILIFNPWPLTKPWAGSSIKTPLSHSVSTKVPDWLKLLSMNQLYRVTDTICLETKLLDELFIYVQNSPDPIISSTNEKPQIAFNNPHDHNWTKNLFDI